MHYFEIKNQKNDLMIENKNYELIYSERENSKEAKFEQESIFPLSVFYLRRRRSNGNTVSCPLLTEKVILIALLLLVWYGKRPAGTGTEQYKLSFSEEFLSFQI